MQFDFTLGANQSQQVDVRGKFFKCTSATGKVRVRTNTGESIDLLPGQGVWNVDYQWLSVQDRTGAANTGTLIAGDFDFHDDRITGDVNVLDNGKARSLSGASEFLIRTSGPVAAQYSWAQLFNSTGAAKSIAINKLTVQSDTTGPVNIYSCTTEAAAGLAYFSTRAFGLAHGVAKSYGGTDANSPPTPLSTELLLGAIQVGGGSQVDLPMRDPIILLPGHGLGIYHRVANASLTVLVDVEEF
jgi:hypothetical protein